MKPSKYQESIFDFVKNGTGNAIVDAVPGSGKTTTIVKALEFIPPNLDVLFCAFNKHIADELKTRVPANCSVGTLNSLGWQICLKRVGYIKLNVNKVDNILRYNVYNDKSKGR